MKKEMEKAREESGPFYISKKIMRKKKKKKNRLKCINEKAIRAMKVSFKLIFLLHH